MHSASKFYGVKMYPPVFCTSAESVKKKNLFWSKGRISTSVTVRKFDVMIIENKISIAVSDLQY